MTWTFISVSAQTCAISLGQCQSGLRSRSFLGGVGFFCPAPTVQLDHFFTSHS